MMKCGGVLVVGLLVSCSAFAADPVVGSVTASVGGVENAHTVRVTFTFSDAEGDACHIALFGHYTVTRAHYPMRTFAEGDIHSQTFTPGTHTVTWFASAVRKARARVL